MGNAQKAVRYVALTELAVTAGVGPRRLRVLCQEGRVEGAVLVAGRWIAPAGAKVDRMGPGRPRLQKVTPQPA